MGGNGASVVVAGGGLGANRGTLLSLGFTLGAPHYHRGAVAWQGVRRSHLVFLHQSRCVVPPKAS